MKSLFICLAMACLVSFFGCISSQNVADEQSRFISATDKIYVAIKTVVTDEEAKSFIGEEDIKKLAQLESRYLSAKELLESDTTDAESLLDLTECAEDVLVIIGKESLKEKYGAEITAIRLGIKVLINLYTT